MKHILSITLCTLCVIYTHAAEPRHLSLQECRELAVESNINLKSSNERIEASRDILSAYKSNHLPNFSLNGNFLYSTTSFDYAIKGGQLPLFNMDGTPMAGFAYMPDIAFDVEVGSIYSVGAQVTQPIYLGGKISNAIKLARIGISISELSEERTYREVILSIDEAFYNVLKVSEMVIAAHKYQNVVEEFHRQMTNGYKSGMRHRNDLLKVEVRLNEAKLLTQKAENGLRLAKMNLCYNIGLPLSTTNISVNDNFDTELIIDPSNLDISARPEYEMLQKQIEAKELETKITRSDFLPSVSAIASYGYGNGLKLNGNKIVNNATFNGGVIMSVPLFHWGEGRRKSSAKRREVTIAQYEFEDLSQKMTLELMQAINNYEDATLKVALTQTSVTQAEENMRLCENQYNAGMETIADLLEAQALWQKAMSDLTEAHAAQRIAYTTYLKCRGDI